MTPAALMVLAMVQGMQTEAAASPCVSSIYTSPLYSPAAWQLVPDSTVPPGLVDAAEAAWNSPSCNTSGTAFPMFTTSPSAGSKPVPVTYVNGLNPSNPRSCGQTAPSGITIYSQAKMPSGTTASCGSGNVQTQTLEHELGHQLGLADSSCAGYIMSQVASPPQTGSIPPQPMPRAIQGPNAARPTRSTSRRQSSCPRPAPNQCPPECQCPPSCLSGCDVNGVCKDNPCDTDPTSPQCGGDGGGSPCDAGSSL